MKHIKDRKLFEQKSNFHSNLRDILLDGMNSPMIDDIKDICLDMLDNGFFIELYPDSAGGISIIKNNICLTIWKFPNEKHTAGNQIPFKYSEISEDVERLKSYLGNKVKEMGKWVNEWVPLEVYSGSTINGLIITFKLK